MSRGALSVVIPSYNHAEFVRQAIDSVLAQTYRPLELVVVDDGSTDDSAAVIESAVAKHGLDSVRVELQDNHGAHHAINRGFEIASGEYLSILNSDDAYDPGRFNRLMPLTARPCAGVVFAGLRFIDEQGAMLPAEHAWPAWYAKCLEETDDLPTVSYRILVHNFSVTSGNFLFHRDLYTALGGFCEHRFAHDWDFLLRSVSLAEPLFDPRQLMSYRIHGANTTEGVRELMGHECMASLEAYARLCQVETRNPMAPCSANWPRFFDTFLARRRPFFADVGSFSDLGLTW